MQVGVVFTEMGRCDERHEEGDRLHFQEQVISQAVKCTSSPSGLLREVFFLLLGNEL
jgi:hypothetical protein